MKFLQLLLESEPYQKRMLDDAGGSTIKHIYITVVDKMLIGAPKNRSEQVRVSHKTEMLSQRLVAESEMLKKLQKQKLGLVYALLTGKVPVEVKPEGESETASA